MGTMRTSHQPRTGVPPPKLSGPTLASKEGRHSSQGKKRCVTPGQGAASYWLSSAATILRKSHLLPAAEGWRRMYRMSRLLSKIEWLLVDEPKGRDLFLAALFLFMSFFAVAIPLLGLYGKPESVPGDLVPLTLVAPTFLAWAVLYAVPGRCE